ncbi:hypothetical protein SNOG_20159 [Parastagonospora nodorum SN15]|uniref:Uncharacterized protein n=1 Tax=Phaeosphaeria nodorum (strain SN15 / ATCC MYA-4574 / FGSC 10173) TaxID=321614 RepID=A9JXF5_PHANO|nr:hypothetical protein SNOG_20159 [Parastagonospora nodorum SN15]EDP89856.1 hypothetical protein SNOG_20159 [Parastagonospora nodorum SN15]
MVQTLMPHSLPNAQTLVSPHHAASFKLGPALDYLAIRDELADDADWLLAGQSAEIHGGLCVSSAHADAAVARLQWQYVAWSPEACGL